MDGYAWQVNAGGLNLIPVPKAPVSPPPGFAEARDEGYSTSSFSFKGLGDERPASAANVFKERASSPFQRYPTARSEPGSLARTELGEQHSLRPTTSDPYSYQQATSDKWPSSANPGWVGSVPKGPVSTPTQAIEQGTRGPRPTSPHEHDFQQARNITPIRPRVIYPQSPGGTEIRPPPIQKSPKKPRTTPSPTRPKASESPNPKPPPPEPQNDIQRLTAVLEGVFRKDRSGDSKVEDVNTIPELPKLDIKDHEKELTPLIAGDWLTVIGPSLRDLSAQASTWWSEVVATAQAYYNKWLAKGPVDRLLMRPERPTRYDSGPFVRVEQQAVALLLKAIPQYIREDIVATRRMTSIDIIGTILTTFQPGGLRERTALLKFLTTPESAKIGRRSP